MRKILRAALRDSGGATAVEYGLILALLVVAMMVSLTNVATSTSLMWNNIAATTSKS
jgi:pilus assembly protein Flp/PilA